MGKFVLYAACSVLLLVLFSSTSLGEEETNDVDEAYERGIREAGGGEIRKSSRRERNRRKKGKKVKGRKTNKPKKSKGKKSSRNNKKAKGRKALKRKGTNEKKMKGKGKSKRKPSLRRDTKSTFCPTEKATSLKLFYNQVYNFKKQLKRAQSQASIVKKKKDKKDNFAKDAAILTDAVGGNLTSPTCSAKGRSATNAASQGSTLSSCSSTIASSCEEITINSTLTGTCSDTMTTFEAKVTTCKTDDSCTCWTEAFAMKAAITGCSALEEANSVKAKKKTCLQTFSGCKSAQDSAVQYTATCPTKTELVTAVPMATTTNSARRRNFVEKFLSRNLMRRSHDGAMKA